LKSIGSADGNLLIHRICPKNSLLGQNAGQFLQIRFLIKVLALVLPLSPKQICLLQG